MKQHLKLWKAELVGDVAVPGWALLALAFAPVVQSLIIFKDIVALIHK